ncbi:DUF192 domain-containing protein [Pseudalkalibacillus sp. SCS-8]|uniref:DUF192 domain-containing protein n=1 Tax=Pseudalkalibacillus nanhaiensis TaxID=3115291 RepID=UPI0032DB1A24
MLELINLSTGKSIAHTVIPAYSFFKRLKGLMFTSYFSEGYAVHIRPCRSIHTYFMNYEIDILYLNQANQIIAVDCSVPPKTIGKHYKGTHSVIELPAGTIQRTNTEIGQAVQIQKTKERVS